MNEIRQSESVSSALDNVIKNHDSLNGSKPESLDTSCAILVRSFKKDPTSVLGPICEQITRTTKKRKRLPYFNVSAYLYDQATKEFDSFLISTIELYSKTQENRRQIMGSSILIRSLAVTSCLPSLVSPFSSIIKSFSSDQPSLIEMEIFDTIVYTFTSLQVRGQPVIDALTIYSQWMEKRRQIVSTAATELKSLISVRMADNSLFSLLPSLRSDISQSSESNQSLWKSIAASPFDKPELWIALGLYLGKLDEEPLRNEISVISSEKGQFSSVITVALSVENQTIQRIAKAFFRFGIHGKETASFDPSSLSSILEQTDELTDIAMTFLSEMTLANASECIPQLFPLLQSEKPIGRKNALALLKKIVDGNVEPNIREMIAIQLLPLVGDESISVRVDVPKLFESISPKFILPRLIDMLADKSEKRRSTATSCVKAIFANTKDPELLLSTILDYCLHPNGVPTSPAAIEAPVINIKTSKKALDLMEDWAKDKTLFLDPSPIMQKLWADPQNEVIVSFISKASPLFDRQRLLSNLLGRLSSQLNSLFDRLAPLLVLRSQPLDFFHQREIVASQLFDLLFKAQEDERQVQRLRGEIIARFPPQIVMQRLMEDGLLKKFSLYIVCVSGQIHQQPLPLVVDEIEKALGEDQKELFEPLCDAFYFSDRERFLRYIFGLEANKTHFLMVSSAFRKFGLPECKEFIKAGRLELLLSRKFSEECDLLAVDCLFLFAYKCNDQTLDGFWDNFFDVASNFSDSKVAGVRLESLKLIGALIANPCVESHLMNVYQRLTHILSVLSEDSESDQIRKLAQQILDSMKPTVPQEGDLN